MNDENLIPLNKRTKSAQREIQSKGGRSSRDAARKRIALREITSILINARAELDSEQIARFTAKGLDVEDITIQVQMVQAQIEKAVGGDTKSFEVVRDTVGEKPKDNMSIEMATGVEVIIDGKPKS